MAKTKISEFSSTPANNTDIDSINIAEGCAPSGINDAIRELMAQLKDFQTGAAGDSFNGPIGTSTPAAGAFTTLSATGAITSTLATGTAPLVIASTTKVTNLNVDLLDGADWASPAALGSTTPAAVSATTLSASGAVSGTGFSNYLASPPAIGGTTAAAGSFTTVNNSGGVRFNTSGTEYARVQLNSTSLELMAGSTTTAGITLNSSNVATLTNNPVLTAGTANGVTYLNGSKQLVSGSALTFNGSNLFTVVPATGTAYNRTESAQYSTWLQTGAGNANVFWEFSAGTPVRWVDTSAGELMRLTSTGLGIGTSSPSYKLDVVGTAGYNAYIYDSPTTGGVLIGGSSTRGLITSNSGTKGLALQINGVTALDIDSAGNLGLGVTPSAGGGVLQLKSGITFPATQSASSDANTLDDYEEGTWTPEMSFGNDTTGITYSTQVGTYEKIGRQVTLRCHICFTNNGSGSGIAKLSGFPFTLLAASNAAAAFSIFTDVTLSGTYYASAVPQASSTFAYFRMSDAYMTETQFTNTANFTFMTSYNV